MSMFSYFKFDDRTDPKIKIAANLSFLACFGTAGWIASLMNFMNFTKQEFNLTAFDFGLILSVNETAVLFGFIISIMLAYISESRLLGILVALAGTAITLCTFAQFEIPLLSSVYTLIGDRISSFTVNMAIFAFIISLSYEYFEASKESLVKHSTDSADTPIILSKITAYGLLGTASGFLTVTVLGFIPMNIVLESGSADIKYYILYPLIGLPLIVIGIFSSKKAMAAKALKENIEFILRGKFFNFYILTFFTSIINIIMIYFGAFFLVEKFHMGLGFIGLIFLLHSSLVFFLRRKATEIMKNKGEDVTMKIRYLVSFIFFLVLIFTATPLVAEDSFMKYVLLGILSLYGTTTLFDNAIKSFISYFATPNEQRSNAVIYDRLIFAAKIVFPFTTGLLYFNFGDAYGYYAVFGLGAVSAALCLIVSFRIYAAYNDSDDGGIVEEG